VIRVGFLLGLFLGVLALARGAAVWAQPGTASGRGIPAITLTLKDASPEEAAKVLSGALGESITIEPTSGSLPHVTLQLQDATPLETLERFAASLHGRWQTVYTVAPAVPNAAPHRPPFATGRRVSLSLENVTPRVALHTVAAADQGIMEGTAAEEPRISLKMDAVPVEEGMDRVSGVLGLQWSRRFLIIPGPVRSLPLKPPGTLATGPASTNASDLPAPPPPAEKLFSLAEPTSLPLPAPERAPAMKTPDLARSLSDGMARLMQVDPSRRGGAVRQFAQQVERGLRDLDRLPAPEQALQHTRLARVYQSGMRMYRGLTPDQQQEFRPLFDVLRRWLKL
jgi:hypothetical protein